jgi:hypothetical protein
MGLLPPSPPTTRVGDVDIESTANLKESQGTAWQIARRFSEGRLVLAKHGELAHCRHDQVKATYPKLKTSVPM